MSHRPSRPDSISFIGKRSENRGGGSLEWSERGAEARRDDSTRGMNERSTLFCLVATIAFFLQGLVILGAGFSESDRERDSAARARSHADPTRDDQTIVPFDYPAIVRNVCFFEHLLCLLK